MQAVLQTIGVNQHVKCGSGLMPEAGGQLQLHDLRQEAQRTHCGNAYDGRRRCGAGAHGDAGGVCGCTTSGRKRSAPSPASLSLPLPASCHSRDGTLAVTRIIARFVTAHQTPHRCRCHCPHPAMRMAAPLE